MVKKYHIFTITNEDIDDAIRQSYKQLRELSDNDEEFKVNKKLFNKTRREMREHPKQHYKQIVQQITKEFEEIEYKFHGRFFTVVENYMVANGKAADEQKSPDAGMDM